MAKVKPSRCDICKEVFHDEIIEKYNSVRKARDMWRNVSILMAGGWLITFVIACANMIG